MAVVMVFLILALACAGLLWRPGVATWPPRATPVSPTELVAGPELTEVSLLLELMGAALDAGASVPGAMQEVAAVAAAPLQQGLLQVVAGLQLGASWERAWAGSAADPDLYAIRQALSFSVLTGAATAPLLYAQARQVRRQERRRAEERAAALGVRLVVPLGLCSLPAFICLGIIPVVVAMVPSG